MKTNSDCGFTSRLRNKSVSIMRWQGSWNSFHLQQKMQMVSTLRCTSIHTLRDLTRELTWTSREPLRYFFSPFEVFYCMTTWNCTAFLRTLSNPIRRSTENSWWQSTSWTNHWRWRRQTLIIVQCIGCNFIRIYLCKSSLVYREGERRGMFRERRFVIKRAYKTDCELCFSQQPALLRLKQHISEKSRTTQSQVITEEEAFDQVKLLIPIIHRVFLFELVKITFRWKLELLS